MKFINKFRVMERTGLNMCEIYDLMAKKQFPRCYTQGGGMMGCQVEVWIETEINEWVAK